MVKTLKKFEGLQKHMLEQKKLNHKNWHVPNDERKSEGGFVSPAANLTSKAIPKQIPIN